MAQIEINIRHASVEDVQAITDIFNHYIVHSTATFYTEPLSYEDRLQWFSKRSERHPVFVACSVNKVIGWACLSEYKARPAYSETVESAIYLHPDWLGRGIGKLLMQHVISSARSSGFHTLLAGACTDPQESTQLHLALGFKQVAHFEQVGKKFDRWLDVAYFQLAL
jgi:L-amino acid N-acyltransferase